MGNRNKRRGSRAKLIGDWKKGSLWKGNLQNERSEKGPDPVIMPGQGNRHGESARNWHGAWEGFGQEKEKEQFWEGIGLE